MAAVQPLWRHAEARDQLTLVNDAILAYFSAMIVQKQIQMHPYEQVIQFCSYLGSFVVFSPQQQFIKYASGVEETIIFFIDYLEGFG